MLSCGRNLALSLDERFEDMPGSPGALLHRGPLRVKSTADEVPLAGSFSVGLFPNRACKFPRTLLSSDHFG